MFAQTTVNVPASNAVTTSTIADGNVTTVKINDDAVTLAKMAGLARGKLIVGDATGNLSAFALGSANNVLTSDGTDVTWATASGTTINNNADNRIITGSGTTNTLEGEATLTFDGNNNLKVIAAGNTTTGGNIQLGITTDDAAKYTAITAQQHDSGTETEGFTLIGGNSAANDSNLVNIGGGFGEQNPATSLRFFTGSAATREGSVKATIISSGNFGIGTTTPSAKLHVHTSGAEGINIGLQNSERYWNMETDGGLLMVKDVTAGGLTRMAFDTSGNVGIGQASDGDKLHVLGTGFFEDSRGNGVGVQINGGSGSEFAHIGVSASNPFTFQTANTERMRIAGNGSIQVGRTSVITASDKFTVEKSTGAGYTMTSSATTALGGVYYYHSYIANGSQTGYVSSNGSTTSYNTSSDYRLKENVVTDWDATTRLKQLKPSRFNFIADAETTVDGFLAHEVQDIVPEAITGDKDATETYTDDNGDEQTRPVYQGIDQAKLVPLLVKTIQELEARITTLESS